MQLLIWPIYMNVMLIAHDMEFEGPEFWVMTKFILRHSERVKRRKKEEKKNMLVIHDSPLTLNNI